MADYEKKDFEDVIRIVVFLIILSIGFLFSLYRISDIVNNSKEHISSIANKEEKVTDFPEAFDDFYNSLYSEQPWSLYAFSFTQKVLSKHETRSFEVLKANDGELFLFGNEGPVDTEKLKKVADQYQYICEETQKYGGVFLYVQAPFKNVSQAPELLPYSADNTEESETYLDNLIRERGMPVLDLRDYKECIEYYNTDHHWTSKAGFNASRIISEEVERLYGIELTGSDYYGNIDNYEPMTYKKCFLGSIGIKVGPYFAGKDDITIYNPKFETDLIYHHYGEKRPFDYSGDFWTTFVDQDALLDTTYNNKYQANMHGCYRESVIINNMAQDPYKCLLIAHSYGRNMAMYMALNYHEYRYLDPQPGAFNDNVIDYIRDYQPDVVIVMYNELVNVGDE